MERKLAARPITRFRGFDHVDFKAYEENPRFTERQICVNENQLLAPD